MPSCMEDAACRAAAIDLADGSPGAQAVCCDAFFPAKLCDGTRIGLIIAFILFTALAPLPILLWWMNKQLNAPAGQAAEVQFLQAPGGDKSTAAADR